VKYPFSNKAHREVSLKVHLLLEASLAGLLQIPRIVTSSMGALMEDYLLVKIIEMELPELSMYGLIIPWDMEPRA
jgi:hypothetical protein